jgi:hypothetical protein
VLIKMKTTSCGPDSPTRHADKIYDVETKEAKALIAGGFAEAVGKEGKEDTEVETTALTGAPETAVGVRQRDKK